MQKQIENIFSSTKTKSSIKCPNPNTPIIIDTREKQSLIAANLLEQKASIKFEKLEIADYLVNDIAIERKTLNDFANSILNKRLLNQIKNLTKYENKILILESFYYNYDDFKIHENAIRGMILSITTSFKIPIIYTQNEKDTAKFLILLAKRQDKPKTNFALRQSRDLKTLEEQKQFILEGFPGIGPTTAKYLLEKYETLQNIFKTTKEELEKSGLNEKQIDKFKELLEK